MPETKYVYYSANDRNISKMYICYEKEDHYLIIEKSFPMNEELNKFLLKKDEYEEWLLMTGAKDSMREAIEDDIRGSKNRLKWRLEDLKNKMKDLSIGLWLLIKAYKDMLFL